MEQFRYAEAAEAFKSVLKAMPNWTAARFNLGLAYLNMAGQMAGASQAEAGSTSQKQLRDLAIESFQGVLAADAENISAMYCLGTVYDFVGEPDKAVQYFQQAFEADQQDNFAGYSYAKALNGSGQRERAAKILEDIVLRDPGFVSAVYSLATHYVRSQQRPKAMELFRRFRALNAEELAVGSHVVDGKYGMAGRHHLVLSADNLPLPGPLKNRSGWPLFSPRVRTLDTRLEAWQSDENVLHLPSIAVADLDQDGDLDIVLGGHGPNGEAFAWLNDGEGNFSRGAAIAQQVISPQCGDIDNDGDVDLWLGCSGPDRVMLNDGAGVFQDAALPGFTNPQAMTSVAGLADVDSDGDLDLLAMRLATGSVPASPTVAATASSVFVNNTDGTFSDRSSDLGLSLPDYPISSVVMDDIDNDHDLDFILFSFKSPPKVWVNFRLGEYRLLESEQTGLTISGVISATSGDPDKDGDRDLLVFTAEGSQLFLNDGRLQFQSYSLFAAGCGRLGGTGGQFVDMDNDGDLDLVVADAQRADRSRGPVVLVNCWPDFKFVRLSEIDARSLLPAITTVGHASCVAADFTGNGRCDLFLAAAGEAPRLIENVTPDGHWIAFDLVGKRPQEPKARSSNSAIGARLEVKSGLLHQQYVVGGSCGPVAATPLRVHAGLGDHPRLEWLRIIWPDTILQAELELAANRTVTIEEQSRKPSSCPYLFAWDGSRFEFVGDFGGVGGLGYLVAPKVYACPDPTEYLPLRNLQPRGDQYVLQSLTPLEEITYFDEAKLIAVDHPQGTEIHPHEMMAIGVAPPEFRLFCVRSPIEPIAAVNHLGEDIRDKLAQVDRVYAGATQADARFMGMAKPHFVELDFGDQLANMETGASLILFLQGWVEYGYSSTNYAASQAGQVARAPTLEVFRNGQWVTVMREVGYPAGINHMMTIDVTGAVRPTDRKLRVSSNMELYWDRIYLGRHEPAPLTGQRSCCAQCRSAFSRLSSRVLAGRSASESVRLRKRRPECRLEADGRELHAFR